jgi:glyoxylase-like metal-dependent hydrolase (beta-lactamase superfamily II)
LKTECGFEMLTLSANLMGRPRMIHPTLIWDGSHRILVDTGFPGQLPLIRQALEENGVSFDQLDRVILTHHDIDHIGNLASIEKELSGKVLTMAQTDEEPYINGEKRPLKLAQLEANPGGIPEESKPFYEMLSTAFQNSRAQIDQTLSDGEELPYAGGIIVIHTPGHTLGHICLYLKQWKTLIAGDALAVENGNLGMASARLNYDMDLCKQSLKKLTHFDIETVICYHGGLFQDQPNQKIAALAQGG